MKKALLIIWIPVILSGCKFSRSVEKDLISGLTSTGRDITCEDVYLEMYGEKTSRNSFTYGETFFIYFNDIKGFASENGSVFPGLELNIMDSNGDTILRAEDLYEGYADGISFSPLVLSSDLTLADPIHSGGKYKAAFHIWDKKGSGTFNSEFEFEVVENKKITVKPKNTSYTEVYLFSQAYNRVVADNVIEFDDNIFIIAEGLKGFSEENGKVSPGIQLKGTDSKGNVILSYDDLFADYNDSEIDASEFSTRVSANFRLTGMEFNNPLQCVVRIWDKKSNASLTISTGITVNSMIK